MKTRQPALSEVLGHGPGDKRLDILRRIGEAGSISEAARGAGVSYKAAWQALETLGNLAGTALVEKAVGGSGGGGAVLTPAGQRVLAAAELLAQARAQVLRQVEHGGTGLAAMALRTSMRNQFPCSVRALLRQGGMVRVELAMAEGPSLVSRITGESAELLGLRPGLAVLALCKATAVRMAAEHLPASALNRLEGVVTRASRAAAGGEVSLQLAGGVHLVGFAAAGHGLRKGQAAMAGVEEAGVVIAVAG